MQAFGLLSTSKFYMACFAESALRIMLCRLGREPYMIAVCKKSLASHGEGQDAV